MEMNRTDVESQRRQPLLREANYDNYQDQEYDDSHQDENDANDRYQDSIQDSFCVNAFSFGFSLIKLIATMIFLLMPHKGCNQPLIFYLFGSGVYEIFNLFLTSYMMRLQRSNEGGDFEINYEDKKCVGVMKDLKQMFFLVMFIFGNFWVFDGVSNCKKEDPILYYVCLVYLLIGYLYLLYPVLLLLALCLCFPCIYYVINRWNRGISDTKPALEKSIKDLLVEKYDKAKHPELECVICRTDYEADNDIMHLKCTGKHYFHKDCIITWLRINGTCPYCRQRVDEKKD